MRKLAMPIITAALFLSLLPSVADCMLSPQLRWTQAYRADMRHDQNSIYINKFAAVLVVADKEGKELLRFIPYFEARRNFERGIWERNALGLEVGRNIFPSVYLGERIQAIWVKEDYQDYTHNKRRDAAESVTQLLLSRNIIKTDKLQVEGFLSEEFAYDFDIGAGVRNEVALGVIVPLHKNVETQLNWRHIDRIGDFDSDAVEVAATLVF